MNTSSKALLTAVVLLLTPVIASAHPGHGESPLMHAIEAIEHIAIGGLFVGLTGGLLVALVQRLLKHDA
jgi:hypothetical protein